MTLGHYKEAESHLLRALALDSTYAVAKYSLSVSYTQEGRYPEAINILEHLLAVPGVRPIELRASLAEAYARAGRTADARRMIAEAERTGHGRVTGTLAAALMAAGERDRAISVLRTTIEQHDPWMNNFAKSARYKELRADSVGGAMLARTETQ
jgi:tetratricopeptide (TPR) repeat protein